MTTTITVANRILISTLRRPHTNPNLLPLALSRRHASTSKLDKSRILEKPSKFNPPSHGARRVKPRMYPGPKPTEEEFDAQQTRRYPNMMPPDGTFMHWFLNNRLLHVWISLGVLTTLGIYSLALSFIHSTEFRNELPSSSGFFGHPFQSMKQWISVYKLHVEHESQITADKRRKKIEDAEKRKEFLRAHGVEPGFLTGSWMEKFGTIEGDQAREALQKKMEDEKMQKAEDEAMSPQSAAALEDLYVQQQREKPKRKIWFGIW